MTLRWYLTALTLATLLPVAIFAAVVGYFLVEQERDTFRRGAEERTLALLTAVDVELKGSIDTIEALSSLASLTEDNLPYFRETAARVLASQPDWANINLALPDRQRVVDLLAPEGAPLPRIQDFEGSFERLLQARKPVVGDLALGPVTKRWNFTVRVPVIRDGATKYVLSAVVEPDSIGQLVGTQDLPAGWVAVVLDRNDRIVARTVEPEKSRGQVASQSLRDALARAPSGWFRGSTIEGTEVYTPYRRSQATGWAFAMGIPAEAVDAAAARAAWLLALGLLGAIGLAIAFAHLVGRRISAPIASLAAATEAMGRGEPVQVAESRGVAEIRSLEAALRAAGQSQAALRESVERTRSVVDHVIDGIITIDERGAVETFNPAAERIFGYPAPEVVGRNVRMLMPEPYRRDHDSYLANYLRTGQAKIIGIGREVEGRRKDGSTFPMDLAVSAFYIGSRRRFTGIVRDITERKRAEQALREANRAKDEFLAMLSHELRNPLAALTTAAHVLRVAEPGQGAAAQARGVVDRQTKHMARLIEDLLDISRVTMGKATLEREILNLADVVSNVVQSWRAAGRLDAARMLLKASPAWVDADRARIEQIFSNLLDNALKFTPAGRIVVSVRQEGGDAVLEVSDEGEGIAPEMSGRMFELFAQGPRGLARSEGGMGIGLALVKRLAEMHRGSVSAASEGPGRGAVFTVRLPAVARPEQEHELAPAPAGKAAGPRRVLIIEDNDDTRQMLRAALTLGGHEVCEAADGAAGLAAAAESRPDVALIDIGLPDIDGYEVARRLRAGSVDGAIVLVALTGYGQAEDQRQALEAGFDLHLTKPVTPERLAQAVAALR